MKRIKQLDISVQVTLLSAVWIIFFVRPSILLTCYFVLGCWQIAGMVYHQVKGCYTGSSMPRYYYHRAILIILILVAAAPPYAAFDFIHGLLLAAAPFLSLLYAFICYKETFRYMIRPLDLV